MFYRYLDIETLRDIDTLGGTCDLDIDTCNVGRILFKVGLNVVACVVYCLTLYFDDWSYLHNIHDPPQLYFNFETLRHYRDLETLLLCVNF